MNVKYFFYDIEVARNFFSAIFRNFQTGEIHTFVIHNVNGGRDDHLSLIKFLRQTETRKIQLIGYFNKSYDDLILREGIHTNFQSLHHLYECSKWLIEQPEGHKRRVNDFSSPFTFLRADKLFFNQYYWRTLDLATILNMDRYAKGLKALAINLKWNNIQDLPFNPNDPITLNQVEDIVKYNINDVNITSVLFNAVQSEVVLRKNIEDTYDIPNLTSASRTTVGKKILNKLFLEPEGLNMYDDSLRTYRNIMYLKDIIAPNISFTHPNLISLHNKLLSMELGLQEKLKEVVEINNKKYNVMRGGLHSVDKGGHYQSNDQYIYLDYDVASYYPNIMIELSITPDHLPNSFIPVLKDITKTRLDAKERGDKLVANALKIVINAIYGLLNEPHGFLYDPQCQLAVCLNGELYLLMLIEQMEAHGIEVVSANTDGITIKCPRDKINMAREIASNWESHTGFELEEKEYLNMWVKDVNNYIMQVKDKKGNISYKEKGAFVTEYDDPTQLLLKGWEYPVVSKAVRAFLTEGIDYVGYIKNHKDIHDFLQTKKTARGYSFFVPSINGDIPLQKHNRWVYSNNRYATLICKRKGNKVINVASEPALLLNFINELTPIEEYHINYEWYITEAEKLIASIYPDRFPYLKINKKKKRDPDGYNQLSMFEETI